MGEEVDRTTCRASAVLHKGTDASEAVDFQDIGNPRIGGVIAGQRHRPACRRARSLSSANTDEGASRITGSALQQAAYR